MIIELIAMLILFGLAFWVAKRLGWPDIVQVIIVVVLVVWLVLALLRGGPLLLGGL